MEKYSLDKQKQKIKKPLTGLPYASPAGYPPPSEWIKYSIPSFSQKSTHDIHSCWYTLQINKVDKSDISLKTLKNKTFCGINYE
jgi:hypothetical protein